MTRFAVFVEFQVVAEYHARFQDLILENAAASLRNEPGCRRFDVLTPENAGLAGRFLLYEIYDDATAFAEHLQTEHYRQFDAAVTSLVVKKEVVRLSLVEPGSKP